MSALMGISLWVALVTVVPGLVTIAVISGAILSAKIDIADLPWMNQNISDWMTVSIAITIMVLTQALGILIEGILVRLKFLGDNLQELEIPEGLFGEGKSTKIVFKPYNEYKSLYILLARLSTEDSQGHLRRGVAQFFLTINTLVSFLVGIALTFALLIMKGVPWELVLYMVGLLVCLLLSYKIAVIRFRVMTESAWAVRTMKFNWQGTSQLKLNSPELISKGV